jgi:hypothetical protein
MFNEFGGGVMPTNENTHTAEGPDTGMDSGRESITRPPRWIKIFGIIAIVFAHLFAILHLTGNRHWDHIPW